MSEYTEGKLHLHDLDIHIEHTESGKVVEHTCIAYANETEKLPDKANMAELVRRWNSQPDLLKACRAWEKVESETSGNNPCPDLALRASYRKEAVRLTTAAIAKAQPSKTEAIDNK